MADPRQRFSAGEFTNRARAAIDDITGRGRTAVVVGGSHFYIRALLVELFPAPPRDPEIKARLAAEWASDPTSVFRRLEEADPEAAENIDPHDRQRVLRALEVFAATGESLSSHWKRHRPLPTFDPLLAVPRRSRSDLYARIDARVDNMFASGMVEEVRRIVASGVSVSAHALKAIGYREVVEMLEGRCDLETAIDNTKRSSRRFAKRQLTWLRGMREDALQWVPPVEEGGAPAVINLWDQHTEGRQLK